VLERAPLVLGRADEQSRAREAGVGADRIAEGRVQGEAVRGHPHEQRLGVVEADQGGGAPGRPGSEGVPLVEDDVVDARRGQVVRDRRAHDAAADDGDLRHQRPAQQCMPASLPHEVLRTSWGP
jgi:hypothetical protein